MSESSLCLPFYRRIWPDFHHKSTPVSKKICINFFDKEVHKQKGLYENY